MVDIIDIGTTYEGRTIKTIKAHAILAEIFSNKLS